MKILRVKKLRKFGSRFEALGVLRSKSWRKQTLIFFIQPLLRPQIAIWIFAIFSRVIFSLFWPLKIKISQKNYMVITLSGCLTILAFKISKKLNFGIKIGILKMMSTNSVSSIHCAALQIGEQIWQNHQYKKN